MRSNCLAVVMMTILINGSIRTSLFAEVPGPNSTGSSSIRRVELPQGVSHQLPDGVHYHEVVEMLERYAKEIKVRPRMDEADQETAEYVSPVTLGQPVVVDQEPAESIVREVEANDERGLWSRIVKTVLPGTLLWRPPMPDRKEPRFYMTCSTLDRPDMKQVNDFGIGGTIAMYRWSPEGNGNEGVQIDTFAVAITRFAELDAMTAVEYRTGVPITFAFGDWSGKIAYEHTSAHLGDEYIRNTGNFPRDAVKEEVVLGLANYLRDDLRVYAQFGYAFHLSTFNDNPKKTRYGAGIEWANPNPTGRRGSPFATFGIECRGDANYTPNITAQVGWLWRGEALRPSMRLGVEAYDGRSPFYQFIDRHESWIAFLVAFDY